MKLSKEILVSVFITAMILAVIGGVTTIVLANSNNNKPADAQTVQTYQQREADYNQLIQQANQQLQEANSKLEALQAQSAPIQQQAAPAALAAAISAEKAEQLARQVVDPGQLLQKQAELVSFEGKAAYEVNFQKGAVYVDAQSGQVLFNGTIPQEVTLDKAAQIAADYLKEKDVVLADKITFRGGPLYRVVFKDGVMAYLDMTGQITYVLHSVPKSAIVEQSQGSSSGQGQSSGGGYSDNGFDDHNNGGGGDF